MIPTIPYHTHCGQNFEEINRKTTIDTNFVRSGFCSLYVITVCNEVAQGNIFTSVCQSFCSPGGRGCLADIPLCRHPLGRHTPRQTPPGQIPPQADTPWADTPRPVHAGIHTLPTQYMLGYTPLPSACWDTHPHPVHAGIHIPPTPSACWDTHTPPWWPLHSYWNAFLLRSVYTLSTAVDGMHPTRMHSC